MRTTDSPAWAVYLKATGSKLGLADVHGAVCEQAEWEQMERDSPGRHTLIRANVASEQEAEALAREASGYVPSPAGNRKGRPNPAKRPPECNPSLAASVLPR